MGLLYYVSYVAIVVVFAFVTLSLASGLLYVSELIEEHSRLAKTIGQRGTYAVIVLHLVFYATDSLPFLQTIFSVICHVVYLQNFSNTWPVISLSSLPFVASCILVIVDHFMWFFYFAQLTQDARNYRYRGRAGPQVPSFTEVATFFGLCVWLVPLFFFLSLSANDNALPTSLSTPGTPSLTATQHTKQPRISLFRSLLSFTSLLPASIRPKDSRMPEGLIAPPQSPVPFLRPQSMSSSSFRGSQHSMTPPRSPIIRQGSLESSPPSTFRSGTPPLRKPGLTMRRTSGFSEGDTSKKG
ncbi:hypothetical protein E1B28_004136 [Marasmius oreades]|uniref:DUF396-domain-containing protein n=1 Tax=Marasmius oreades TaxID=181124 RepID=A0A9P7UY70_9AGAR|nr:uncharacterized protein E1B28_004136 [Marasmius oreades]KAG7096723.1 hypothetical protein E1B28_004136 [Marasmius oreades]